MLNDRRIPLIYVLKKHPKSISEVKLYFSNLNKDSVIQHIPNSVFIFQTYMPIIDMS